jgi:hypothetical protein
VYYNPLGKPHPNKAREDKNATFLDTNPFDTQGQINSGGRSYNSIMRERYLRKASGGVFVTLKKWWKENKGNENDEQIGECFDRGKIKKK